MAPRFALIAHAVIDYITTVVIESPRCRLTFLRMEKSFDVIQRQSEETINNKLCFGELFSGIGIGYRETSHSCLLCRSNTVNGIFDHQTLPRLDSTSRWQVEEFKCFDEWIGMRLTARRIFSADDRSETISQPAVIHDRLDLRSERAGCNSKRISLCCSVYKLRGSWQQCELCFHRVFDVSGLPRDQLRQFIRRH